MRSRRQLQAVETRGVVQQRGVTVLTDLGNDICYRLLDLQLGAGIAVQ